jgi:hypothetical protein
MTGLIELFAPLEEVTERLRDEIARLLGGVSCRLGEQQVLRLAALAQDDNFIFWGGSAQDDGLA